MSNGLGELLSKARENLEISLEAAANATKIRQDFLENFEKNSFSFNLPDIYKREFLKTYAEFLKLDTQEVMALCPIKAFVPLITSSKRREMVQEVAKKSLAIDHSNLEVKSDPELAEGPDSDYKQSSEKFKKKYVYIAAGVSLSLLLFMLFLSRNSSRPTVESTNNSVKNTSAIDPGAGLISNQTKKKISLMSTDKVKILIKIKDTNYYDNGKALSIELSSGERLHLESGLGAVEIK
ncbi:MAG: helix-turn-helix domain-containing protein [Puniceicoccales bacterium]|jgi:cytoskeletal protein RodZ|nr:helix-turn-helix domain-containing protein [Puniceicoccales bacterium]